jgi:type IV pilus assembly protein PilW
MLTRHQSVNTHRQRGLSIIELLVGVAVGLFIIGGAVKVFVDMIGDNRRQVVEVRVNQDLRAAADIIARDLRRAGYWRNSMTAVNPLPPALPASNPYGDVTFTANSVSYAYDRDGNASIDGGEQAGFQLNGNVIEMRTAVAGNWQALTDPQTMQVTAFSITNSATAQRWTPIWQHCDCISRLTCTAASFAALGSGDPNFPEVSLRWVDVVIEGRATADSKITRRVEESVRLRNDLVRGACPA